MWLAKQFGWTLEYVDSLDVNEARKIVDILQAETKAANAEARWQAELARTKARQG